MIIEDKGLAVLNEFGIFNPQKNNAETLFQESEDQSVKNDVEKQSSDSNSSEIQIFKSSPINSQRSI